MGEKKPSCSGRPGTHYISEALLGDLSIEEWARNSMGCDHCPFSVGSKDKTLFKCSPTVTHELETADGATRIKAVVSPS